MNEIPMKNASIIYISIYSAIIYFLSIFLPFLFLEIIDMFNGTLISQFQFLLQTAIQFCVSS